MSVFIKGVSLHGLRINGGVVPVPVPPNAVFYAPLISSTGSLDIAANPLTAVVSTPTPTTITYTNTHAVFYSLGSNALSNQPSLTYGSIDSKLNPNLYPTQTVYFSAVVNLTGVTFGSSDACNIMSWDTYGSHIIFYAYVTNSAVQILTGIALNSGVNVTEFNGSFPSGDVTLTIAWYPDGTLEWIVNGSVVRTASSTRFGGSLSIGGSSAGVYEIAIKDVTYSVTAS